MKKTLFWALWMVMIFLAISSLILPIDPFGQNLAASLQPPGGVHPMGTDELGRDLLHRIVAGGSVSLSIAIVSVSFAVVIGTFIGVVAGYFGGVVESFLMRIMDILLVFPGFLLALATAAIIGPGYWNLIVAVTVFSVPTFARVVRSTVLSVKEREFIEAAHAAGATTLRLISCHLLPNSLGPLAVVATNRLGSAILIAGGLSFLGLGVQPPIAEWGAMLASGRQYLWKAPHLVIFPGMAIFLSALVFNLLGEIGENLFQK